MQCLSMQMCFLMCHVSHNQSNVLTDILASERAHAKSFLWSVALWKLQKLNWQKIFEQQPQSVNSLGTTVTPTRLLRALTEDSNSSRFV